MGEAKRRRDNPAAARAAVERDLRRGFDQSRKMFGDDHFAAIAYGDGTVDAGPPSDMGDGEGVLITFTVGCRGELTEVQAHEAAEGWRRATRRYPKALFYLVFAGYDDDPRELHEFPEVCAYAQEWAKLVGLDDEAAADHWLGTCKGRISLPLEGDKLRGCGFSVLIGLGVFGAEARAEALVRGGFGSTRREN
jgi:hypothetical protein